MKKVVLYEHEKNPPLARFKRMNAWSVDKCYCKTLKFSGSKFWWFYEWTFWQIDILADFQKTKSVISDVARCVLCMQVFCGDLLVIHGDFQLFS